MTALRDRIRAVTQLPWQAVSASGLAFWAVGYGLLLIALWTDRDGFLPVIDHANLAFHEAGHVFFGLFGRTMNLYGGTLGQFVFPAIAMGIFWTRRETLGFAVGWVWLAENLRYVATYMADARAMRLPLLGGGDHDWRNIFLRWDALAADTSVAAVTNAIAWSGMLSGCAWLIWRWWRLRAPVTAAKD
jgi:hypothetical protein